MPALAGTTTLIISGNGSDSDNTTQVSQQSSTTVTQQNNTSVSNDVKVNADTGNNNASGNTNGDVLVDTGDTNVEVAVVNELNRNVAEVAECDCDSETIVEISGNGSDSDNTAKLQTTSQTGVWQLNNAKVSNDVDVKATTGYNRASDNTSGDVAIYTGDVSVAVVEQTMANFNSARILGGSGNGSSVSLLISGNGADSDNEIKLAMDKATLLTQWNNTAIRNDVDVKAITGRNTADDNTGGSVLIDTGNVIMNAFIDNWAGFNAADLDCDCVFDEVLAKIAGNGADSDNTIRAFLNADRQVFQDNECGFGFGPVSVMSLNHGFHGFAPCFDNDVDLDGYTGNNRASDNTGEGGNDPTIYTGDSTSEVGISNKGGENVYGESSFPWQWPGNFGSHFDLSFSFNLTGLLAWLASMT